MRFFKSIAARLDARLDNFLLGGLPCPRIVSIEPVSNLCQLKCPLCPTGAGRLDYDRVLMSFATFRIILDKLPFVKVINLYKSGEPFLNQDIFAMVRHAADRGIKVIISSNFSFVKPEEFFENIVRSGLKKLIISLDGASQKSYEKYRIGGDYELVVANIKKLVKAKERLHGRGPDIVWQFLVNRFNEHEIDAARALADTLGVRLDVQPMDISDNVPDVEFKGTIDERKAYWLGTDKKYVCDRYLGEVRFPLFPEICTQLFLRPVVAADGKVLPCCESWNRSSVFGDLLAEPFEAIWNNRKYRDSRALFLKKGFVPAEQTVCRGCTNFTPGFSLREKLGLLKTVYLRQISYLGKI